MIRGAADWLTTITRDDGGIPFCLPNVVDYPRDPFWQPADESSIIQTAANAAALHALGARHPWLDRADAFVWRWLDALDLATVDADPGTGYEVRFTVIVPQRPPDATAPRPRSTRSPRRLPRRAPSRGRGGDVQTPLDLAPFPDSRARRHVRPGARSTRTWRRSRPRKRDDGGWMSGWDQWNPTASTEWRGVLTLARTPHLAAQLN